MGRSVYVLGLIYIFTSTSTISRRYSLAAMVADDKMSIINEILNSKLKPIKNEHIANCSPLQPQISSTSPLCQFPQFPWREM